MLGCGSSVTDPGCIFSYRMQHFNHCHGMSHCLIDGSTFASLFMQVAKL